MNICENPFYGYQYRLECMSIYHFNQLPLPSLNPFFIDESNHKFIKYQLTQSYPRGGRLHFFIRFPLKKKAACAYLAVFLNFPLN